MYRKILVLFLLACLLPVAFAGDDNKGKESEYRGMGWGVFTGYLWGDELVERSVPADDGTGSYVPTLDDDFILGGLFYVDNTPNLRFEFRLSWNPNTVRDTPHGDLSMDVIVADVAIVPHWNRGRWEVGVPVGFGWAVSMTSEDLAKRIPGRSKNLHLTDGSGMTYFLGLQGSVRLGETWTLFGEYTFKRFHRLTNVIERTPKCGQFLVGFRRAF